MTVECNSLNVRCDRCHDYVVVYDVDEFMGTIPTFGIDDENSDPQLEDWMLDGHRHYCPTCAEHIRKEVETHDE